MSTGDAIYANLTFKKLHAKVASHRSDKIAHIPVSQRYRQYQRTASNMTSFWKRLR